MRVEDLGGLALTLKEGVEVFAMHVFFCNFAGSQRFSNFSGRISYKNVNLPYIRKNLMFSVVVIRLLVLFSMGVLLRSYDVCMLCICLRWEL